MRVCVNMSEKLVFLHKSIFIKRKTIDQVGNTLLKNIHRKKSNKYFLVKGESVSH